MPSRFCLFFCAHFSYFDQKSFYLQTIKFSVKWGLLKMVFWGVEVELYPLRCFFNLLHSLFFTHKSIKHRNYKMYYAITNFSIINQKNNVTAMLRNNILQLGCFYNLSLQKKRHYCKTEKNVSNVTVRFYNFLEINEQEKNFKNSVRDQRTKKISKTTRKKFQKQYLQCFCDLST